MNDRPTSVSEEEIHAYVDGTLPDDARERVERAISRDPALGARINDFFSLNALIHERYDRVLTEPVPRQLKKAAAFPPRVAANWPRFAGMAAALALGIGIGVGASIRLGGNGPVQLASSGDTHAASADTSDVLARRAAFAHVVYMPTVERPPQLGANNEQDFVRWLPNKLGTDIHPPVLSKSGYELMGGRLLQDDHGTMAIFMYRDAKGERVSLSVSRRKESTNATAFKLFRDGPVNVFYWVDGDFGYAVSSGIDREALLNLAHDIQEQLTVAAAQ
jgi:anti-sigma factor RsiW